MRARIIHKEPGNPEAIGLPRVGKIKVGIKNDKGLPESVDYFVSTGPYADHFNREYDQPKRITICFLSDDPMQSCIEQLVYYDSHGKVAARGDGETFEVWNMAKEKRETITTAERPDIMAEIEKLYPSKYGWVTELTLRFLIPKIRSVVGYWQFVTKGKESSIPQIREAFDSVLKIVGKVKMVPFDLLVEFAKSTNPGQSRRYPVVSLVPNADKANMAVMESYTKKKTLEPVNLSEDKKAISE